MPLGLVGWFKCEECLLGWWVGLNVKNACWVGMLV